ncbi:hypothetical protein BBF93_12315 [Hyphomonas sp. CACIAM 19H1]|nr:hypothetical protein BBF93_12315 [Hyphomonas sp. CACIAM 19H1]
MVFPVLRHIHNGLQIGSLLFHGGQMLTVVGQSLGFALNGGGKKTGGLGTSFAGRAPKNSVSGYMGL